MFSLLMAGNDGMWDVQPGVPYHDTFLLSRFLEYTDPSIVASFQPTSVTNLAYLAQLPAVFMSELDRDLQGQEHFRIRLGRVFNLSVVGSEIHYTFQLTHNFGNVPVLNREAFRMAFRMEKFELHRTHWAIKAADLGTALQAIIPQPPAIAAPMQSPPQPAQPALPVVDTLQEFMTYVLELAEHSGEEIFYRGHSDFNYRLEPSLFRRNQTGGYRYLPKEEVMVRELLSVQDAQFVHDRSMLDRLVRMQHFGLPTRLLDVSSNPLVALYFCCSELKKDQMGNELDGEVVILRAPSADILHFDSDRVSCISNLCLMKEEEKDRMDLTLPLPAFNSTADAIKLLNFIKREKPYFDNRIEPSDLQKIVFVRARNTHERMVSQSGAFLLFGKDAILPETGHSSLSVSRVRIRQKNAILAQLDKLNIKASTIYPGIEKAASDIAKKHEVA